MASDIICFISTTRPTAGVTGKRGIWREKLPDAESAVEAADPKVWANARTCPVHAVLGCFGYGNTYSIELYCTLPPQTLQYISVQPGWLEGKPGRITRVIFHDP